MRIQRIKKQAGYTLVEILIASTIFVSVVGMGVATYSSASGFQSKSAVIRETNQALRYTMDAIVRDVRSADSSVSFSDSSGGNYVAKGFVFTDDSGNILDNSIPGSKPGVKIYRKGDGLCKNYIEEVYYKINRVDGKLNQAISYLKPLASDGNIADSNPITGSVNDQNCKTASINLLSDRVNLTVVDTAGGADYTSYFQGNSAISDLDGSGNVVSTDKSAYVDISLEVEPNGSDGGMETSRVFRLKTTVVPRNIY